MGMILATFMLEINTPLSKDMLTIAVSGLVIVCMVFGIIFMLIPLLSVDVLVLHVLTMPIISSSLIGLTNVLLILLFQDNYELMHHLVVDLY